MADPVRRPLLRTLFILLPASWPDEEDGASFVQSYLYTKTFHLLDDTYTGYDWTLASACSGSVDLTIRPSAPSL